MSLTFYPNLEDGDNGTLEERIEVLMESAESFKAVILDESRMLEKKYMSPREQMVSYNWEEIASVLREVRASPETSKYEKQRKGTYLSKLAEIYEVLRAAKMPKLEAVRIALSSEATQLRS